MPGRKLVRLPASAGAPPGRARRRLGQPGVILIRRRAGNRPTWGLVAASVGESRRSSYGKGAWTLVAAPCEHAGMAAADPLLVMRRHVDLLRVRSALCRRAR